MNFQLAKSGRSFKGAMAYYTHDKRAEGDAAQPVTRERVAWAETRNLMTEDPDRATRIMIETARMSDELKARAGIANTGRKGTQPVMAYSLAWHPGEAGGLDRAEMVRAAEASLTVLGLESHQAILIAHRDTAHPHVHVVINRVSPEDGRFATVGPDKVRALDRWAHDYERARENIVSPNRAEKYERIAERRRRHPDPEARRAYVAAREATAEAAGRESRGARLRDAGQALRERHKAEWAAFGRDASAARKAAWQDWEPRLKAEYARVKEDQKPVWRAQFRAERDAARERKRMEQGAVGRLALAWAAAREERAQNPKAAEQSFGRVMLVNFVSREHREKVFGAAAERDRAGLSGRLKRSADARLAGVKERREADVVRATARIAENRQALIARQNAERAALRRDWREVGDGRGRQRPEAGRSADAKREDPFAALDRARAERGQGGDPFAAFDRRRKEAPSESRGRERDDQQDRDR